MRISRLLLLCLLALAACAPSQTTPIRPAPATLTVMAAASLTGAFTEIGAAFTQQNPGVTIEFNFAGSQQLAQQIVQGAPADVFASANAAQMQVVIDGGQAATASPPIFAGNQLVVIVPQANPAAITSLQDLARPGLKLVLAAEQVPAGQYALEFLARAGADPAFPAGYADAVRASVVSYEENVKAVVTKVALGEADAGIVYSTDAAAAEPASLARIEIPAALNITARYPITVLNASSRSAQANAFVDFVLSEAGQVILQQYGFLPAE